MLSAERAESMDTDHYTYDDETSWRYEMRVA